jgi:hypothetical protein
MIDKHKYKKAVDELEPRFGKFILFAVFLREDAPDRWDLLVSSARLEEEKLLGLSEFAKELKRIVGEEEFKKLSRIVTLNRDETGLWIILRSVRATGGVTEVRDVNFSGVQVIHGFVFRADKRDAELETTERATKSPA